MSIASELADLQTNLEAAQSAIEAAGGTVGDTGLAGLSTAIESIPSGGGLPTPEWGRLTCLKWSTDWGMEIDNPVYEATFDKDTFLAFIEEHPLDPSYDNTVTISFSGDFEHEPVTLIIEIYGFIDDPFEGETVTLQSLEEMGVTVTSYDVEEPASIDIKMTTTFGDEVGLILDLNESQYEALGSDYDEYAIDLGGGFSIPREAVVGFEFGYAPTETSESFLYNCTNLVSLDISNWNINTIGSYFLSGCSGFAPSSPLDTSSVTTIGGAFLYGCSSFNQVLDLSNVETIGDAFLYGCSSFNQVLDLGNVGTIGNEFLVQCSSFNHPLDLSNVTSIGNNFMVECSSFNQALDISGITQLNDGFLYNCSSFTQDLDSSNITLIGNRVLYQCTGFNRPLDLSNVTSIGDDFLFRCDRFNQPLDLSSVTQIGADFLYGCSSFNQDLTIPSTTSSIATYFLFGVNSMVSTITCNAPATVFTGSAAQKKYNLATNYSSSSMYTTGVSLAGTYASDWKTALPDSSSSPYRKLIDTTA